VQIIAPEEALIEEMKAIAGGSDYISSLT